MRRFSTSSAAPSPDSEFAASAARSVSAVELEYRIVDVFAVRPLTGNALAVFLDAPGLPTELMQRIAREMNLSETTFVTSSGDSRYTSRIFTPGSELPFAGHPTLGTAWVLRDEGAISGAAIVQETAAGETAITFEDDTVWFDRGGDGGADSTDVDSVVSELGVRPDLVGAAWDLPARAVELRPAIADCGIRQLMVPLGSLQALTELRASDIREPGGTQGVYFFVQTSPEAVTARFFATGLGVPEDPATGSAAAGLGLYLGQRVGPGQIAISQGEQIGRPSTLHVRFEPGRVQVGGRVKPVASGILTL